MKFLVGTKCRIDKAEIMDNFSVGGDLLCDTLDKLETINHWLGGNKVTINGLKKILLNHPKEKKLTIIDVGCGSGDILRSVANFGRRNNYKMTLIGVDANPTAISYAKKLSKKYHEILFLTENIFSNDFEKRKFDVLLATLFLHHFNKDELVRFLSKSLTNAKLGIVVNDLHRHKLAYFLFLALSVFIKNRMVVEDGLTSISRAFKRKDLENISRKINVKPQISWKWAFRFQWIIKK